jgi:predicted transcriptional regulator of viral defense system
MGTISNSPVVRPNADQLFTEHPVLTLDAWAAAIGGDRAMPRAKAAAKYYTKTGRLRRLTRGLYAVVPPGLDPSSFSPDPYLVAVALRKDAVLSHHTALDLLGAAHSTFNRFPYTTESPRRILRVDAMEWPAVAPPVQLVRARQIQFGVRTLDRRGTRLRVTGSERTLVDGFAALRWVGGLEELVESAAGFRDLHLDLLHEYLTLLDRQILYAAIGWFLERHPEVADDSEHLSKRLLPHVPRQPLYLERQRPGGKVQRPWNVIVPPHLALDHGFEGTPR